MTNIINGDVMGIWKGGGRFYQYTCEDCLYAQLEENNINIFCLEHKDYFDRYEEICEWFKYCNYNELVSEYIDYVEEIMKKIE